MDSAVFEVLADSTRRRIVETLDVADRLIMVAEALDSEIARLTVAEDVVRRTSAQMEKSQREFFLRQQLQEIRRLIERFPVPEGFARVDERGQGGGGP